MNRREFIIGSAALSLPFLACCSAHAVSSGVRNFGCYVAPDQSSEVFVHADAAQLTLPDMNSIQTGSGSQMFDYAMARTLGHIARLSNVTPAFAFFEEEGSHNALATPAKILHRAEGTVLFGKKMVVHIFQNFAADRAAAITAICAHEFGHIVAFDRGISNRLMPDPAKPFRSEQFADFYAGWYAGQRKIIEKGYPATVFATMLSSLTVHTRSTHGSQTDRLVAVVQGFKSANENKLTFAEAIAAGERFALAQPVS